MNVHDVVIIGGGVTGAAIARELSRYKLSVALLEKEEELAFGVSKSNSGIIHPGTQNHPDTLKGRLCVEGNRLTRRLSKELGVDFKEVGELIVAFTEDDLSKLDQLKKDAEALGVPGLKTVRKKWLLKNEPNLSHEAVAALYAPTAGIISPYRWVYDLAENAASNGALILTGITVENDNTKNSHDYAREKGINIMGGTHYSTEKPACRAMCEYFIKLGLTAEFIEGEPVFEDL